MNCPAMCLQANYDIIFVKRQGSKHDCSADATKTVFNISPGTENGMVIAICLAIILDGESQSRRLEVFLTLNEEIDMWGGYSRKIFTQSGFRRNMKNNDRPHWQPQNEKLLDRGLI